MTATSKPWANMQAHNDREAAFEQIFLAHYDRVYGLLFRLVGTRAEAEDLAQETFLKLYRQPPQRADSNVGAWLYRVATNLGYNAIRGRNRRAQRETAWVPEQTTAPDAEQQAIRQAEVTAVRAALGRLRSDQVQLLLLRQMGLSYAELAQACDIRPTSVGQMLARATAAFRAAYGEEGGSA